MQYLSRTLSNTIFSMSNTFKVLLINGARQIGKTTLLKHTAEQGRKYVTLDYPADLLLAKTDIQPLAPNRIAISVWNI